MTFTDYVKNIRVEAACRLLTGSRNNVEEIAVAVGYAYLKFFNRLFKKKTGVPPAYRDAGSFPFRHILTGDPQFPSLTRIRSMT
jgi:transcriptional regulator GlxA family with amidase domain